MTAMAQGRRVERFAALIRKEISELIANNIRDERIKNSLVSVTAVEVSSDLQHCKIFVSFFGLSNDISQTLEGLKAASSFLRGELGRRLEIRRTPSITFHLDKGIEKGASVIGLLNRLQSERDKREDAPANEDEF